jgi:hypothetical protein
LELTRLDERCLEHVGKQRKHRVQRLELLGSFAIAILNTSQKLSEHREIKNERRSEERVLKRDVLTN